MVAVVDLVVVVCDQRCYYTVLRIVAGCGGGLAGSMQRDVGI